MKFTWDAKKEEINRKKHGVSFEEACPVFTDRYLLSLLTKSILMRRIDGLQWGKY